MPEDGQLTAPATLLDIMRDRAERYRDKVAFDYSTGAEEHGGAEEHSLLPEIDTSQSFAHYGLDSVHAIRLTTALEAWLGRELSPTLAHDYPTIDLLSRHLAEDRPADKRTVAATETDGPSAFWRLLSDGVDAITETPPDRWDAGAFGNAATGWGGFLDQVDQFDRFALVDAHACQRNQKQMVRQSKAGSALRMRAMAHCCHGGQRIVVPRSSR